ncbi:MAG: PH domain-containing protein, partial [Patescibacteria group bacterium]|nr:PH domain-containing protein [Patescibacteria group bacterium]
MLSKGISYPGQKFDEQVLLFLRRHRFTFYWPWGLIILIMLLTWLAALIIFLINLNGGIFPTQYNALFVVVLGCYFLFILMVFLTAWVSFYFDVVIVTKTHLLVIEQNGFFNRKVSEQSLLRIQDVSAKMKGFWQTWLRFGTVFVETAGEAPNFEMINLPKPHVVANAILKLHDELIASGGYEMGIAEGEGVLRTTKSLGPKMIEENPPFKLMRKI